MNFFKKFLSWLSLGAFASAVPLSLASPANAHNFTDIQGNWAETCIRNLAQQDIVAGYPNNTFRPGDIITRTEYAAMMNQAFPGVPEERQAINFPDVPADYWGQEAIRTAYRKGFLTGYPNGEFRPENIIVRQEAFVSLASGLNYSIPSQPEQLLNATYEDANEIAEYAEGKIAAATERGVLISPPKPQFQQALMGPTDPATRAQIAAALCQQKNIAGVPNSYVVDARMTPPGGIVLGQSCTNESFNYTVSYPNGWVTNAGEGRIPECKVFDSDNVELEYATEDFDEAIYFDLENIPYSEMLNAIGGRNSRVITRRQTTVDGRQAVLVETEKTGGPDIGPEGRSYRYLVDYGDQTLVVRTYEVSGQPYSQNKDVMDQMMNNINTNRSTVSSQ